MQNKFCPECGQENMITAKFCLACSSQFPNIQVKGTTPAVQTPKVTPKPAQKNVRIEIDEDTGEIDSSSNLEEAEPSDDTGIGNYFLQEIAKSLPKKRSTGIKLGDVLETDDTKAGRKALDKRTRPKDAPRTAKAIRESSANKKGAKNLRE